MAWYSNETFKSVIQQNISKSVLGLDRKGKLPAQLIV